MCVLGHYVAATVLVLKHVANFTESADGVKFIAAISVKRCAEIRSAPSVA